MPRGRHDNGRVIFEAKQAGDVETVIEGLKDPEHRAMAARYLGKMGDARAVKPLIRLLSVKDFQARAHAATALGDLRAVEAVPELLACVDRGPEDVMRGWAIDALGRIGSVQAVPRLIEVLESPHEGLRFTAAKALGAIGDPRATEPLRAATENASWLDRRHYRRAIRQVSR